MKNTLLVITFESVIRDFQLAPKCFNCDSLSYRLVTFDIGSMRWRSNFFYVKVNFPKLSITVRFCSNFAHMYVGHTQIALSNIDTIKKFRIRLTITWADHTWPSKRWRSNIFRSRSFFQNCQFLSDFAQTVHTFV
jgi:hypothetical protein